MEQEKLIQQHELVEIINEYEKISSRNNALRIELENTRKKAQSILDSLNRIKLNGSEVSAAKQVVFLEEKNEALQRQEAFALKQYNIVLEEKSSLLEALNRQENKNVILEAENRSLKQSLEAAQVLQVNTLEVKDLIKKTCQKKFGNYCCF
ncbi:MAG: hypothetical protein HRT67_10215 [Flavobacteriaceae bacterium]|nr:hypothetical protein [Flavobacteriaceae bacterium]